MPCVGDKKSQRSFRNTGYWLLDIQKIQNMTSIKKRNHRSGLGALALVAGVAFGYDLTASPRFSPEGTQYQVAGSGIGDQLSPSISFRQTGGWLAWHDNVTDGEGFGVSVRRLTGQLTGLSSFRVNQRSEGDQENAQILQMGDGGAIVVWQGGIKGRQTIMGRVIKADGRFAGDEFAISAEGLDHREPSVAINSSGSILVTWTADGVDGDLAAVQSRLLSPSGEPVAQVLQLNQFTPFHQRSSGVTALPDGSFVAVWISEQQRGQNTVDVFARRLQPNGIPSGEEFLVNSGAKPCATPSVAAFPNGGYVVAWAEHDHTAPGAVWDVASRNYQNGNPTTAPLTLNQRRIGFQGFPKIAVVGDEALVVFRSQGGDGYGESVVGRWVDSKGKTIGEEFVVNSQTSGDQITPNVASDGQGRVVAVWSTYAGLSKGMDLASQRYAMSAPALNAPEPPYVFAASSSRLAISFPEVSGLPVSQYELYMDGSEIPLVLKAGYHTEAGFAPESVHTFRLAYRLEDGRLSPLSAPSQGRTWGEDINLDGIPDDWQAKYYGSNRNLWPAPTSDSDADGVSDREEYLAGTDPKAPSSVLKTFLRRNEQGATLSWNSRPGAFYQVQASNNLKDWSDLGALRFASGEVDSIPVGNLPGNTYYRVNLLR